MYETNGMNSQHHLLKRAMDLVEQGAVKMTMTEYPGALNAPNLAKAHRWLESAVWLKNWCSRGSCSGMVVGQCVTMTKIS